MTFNGKLDVPLSEIPTAGSLKHDIYRHVMSTLGSDIHPARKFQYYNGLAYSVRDRLINQLVLNAFAMTPVRMDAYLDALEAFQPRCLYGYASSLALLAAHAQERGRRRPVCR